VVVEATAILHNPTGLHARPAERFAREASLFRADIAVGKHGGKTVDAKSVLSILTLDGRHGDEILICAEGDDAEDAVAHLSRFVSEGLGEDVAE
jgi:phosphocarrier protein HPr